MWRRLMQNQVFQTPVQDVADLRQSLIDARCKALLLMMDIKDFRHVNASCDI